MSQVQPFTGRDVGRHLGALALGVVVAVVGTGIHRASQPWGLVLALVIVASAGALVRAWTGWSGMLALALGVFTTVAVLAGRGPGGDVLVALDAIGIVWYAGAAVIGLAALLPGRWFSTRPLGAPRA